MVSGKAYEFQRVIPKTIRSRVSSSRIGVSSLRCNGTLKIRSHENPNSASCLSVLRKPVRRASAGACLTRKERAPYGAWNRQLPGHHDQMVVGPEVDQSNSA